MPIRLGFHYHVPARMTDKGVFTPGSQGRFIDSIAPLCTSVFCFLHSPAREEIEYCDHRICAENVHLIPIGPHASVPRRLLSACDVRRIVRTHRKDLDAVLLRGPSPLLPFVGWASRPVPLALLLVSDNLAGIDDMSQPWWRREAIRLLEQWNQRQTRKLAGKGLTFVNSRALPQQLRLRPARLIETRTTTLSENDFFEREDTCHSPQCRLLYCGRMAVEKGALDLMEAVAIMAAKGHDVVLDLVGPTTPGDCTVTELKSLAARHDISARVHVRGYKRLGPELFAMYRDADIFVTASRSSEGFPRAIWEAMAHSLPVVATRVGSIPHFLEHMSSAVVVEPKNPRALAEAVLQLVADGALRQRLIKNGFQLAKENTLEKRAAEMMREIESWAQHKPGARDSIKASQQRVPQS